MKKCFALLLLLVAHRGAAQMAYGVRIAKGTEHKILNVVAGSPAERVGLQADDIFVTINGVTVEGLDDMDIHTKLTARDTATIVIERGGEKKSITMYKIQLRAFGMKCLSGNCINGKGRAALPKDNDREYEGTFLNGDLNGECKIYTADKRLYYSGEVQHYLPHGKGKRYANVDGKNLKMEGKFKEGLFSFGGLYDEVGKEMSYGNYSGEENKPILVGGRKTILYRGKPAILYCADISSSGSYAGEVTIFEGNSDTGRLLSRAKYVWEREGAAKEIDYENGVYYRLEYKKGILQDNGLIYRIADKEMVAKNVKFTTNNVDDLTKNIKEGIFWFGGGKAKLVYWPEGGTLTKMKELYDRLPETADMYTRSRTTTVTPNTVSQPADPEVRSAIQAIRYFIDEEIPERYDDALEIGYATTPKNWDHNSRRVRDIRTELEGECNDLIWKYSKLIPSSLVHELQSARDQIHNKFVLRSSN